MQPGFLYLVELQGTYQFKDRKKKNTHITDLHCALSCRVEQCTSQYITFTDTETGTTVRVKHKNIWLLMEVFQKILGLSHFYAATATAVANSDCLNMLKSKNSHPKKCSNLLHNVDIPYFVTVHDMFAPDLSVNPKHSVMTLN